MNQIKIGEFIASLRKEKNMSQKDLADKLNVSISAISKWERGKCLPDVSLFNDLCEILSISINELLKGEKKVENKETNKIVTQYLEYKEKLNKKRRLYQSIISVLVIIVLLLFIYFVNSYKTIDVYILSGYNDNFKYQNGMLIKSKEDNAFVDGNLTFADRSISSDKILYTAFYIKDNEKYYFISETHSLGGYSVGQNNILDEANGHNIVLWIAYLDENDNVQYEELPLYYERISVNDKLIKFKDLSLNQSKPSSANPKEKTDKHMEEYARQAFAYELYSNHGFKKVEDDNTGEYPVQKEIEKDIYLSYSYVTDNWTLNINKDNHHSIYKYNNQNQTINGSYNEINVTKEKEESLICSKDNKEIPCTKEIEEEINILIDNYNKYNEYQPFKKEA